MKHFKLFSAILAAATMIGATRAVEYTAVQTEMLDDYNEFRSQLNLTEVTANSKLMKTAQLYACKMKGNNYFSHIEADWTRPWDRAKAQWYYWSVGENLINARTRYMNSDEALQLWIDSPGHYRNMINKNWIEAGFWQCGWYWVQLFGNGSTETTTTPTTTTTTTTVINQWWSIKIWNTYFTEQWFLDLLNSFYSSYLNGKKLYLK